MKAGKINRNANSGPSPTNGLRGRGIQMARIAHSTTATTSARGTNFPALRWCPMRRRLMAATQAPAMGPKNKAMSPTAFGPHGAFGVSAGNCGAMATDRVPSWCESVSMISIMFLARSYRDLDAPVFLTTRRVVGAIRIGVRSDRLGFSPTASRYSRAGDAGILHQPLFHRSGAVVGKLNVVRVRTFAVRVAFDQHRRLAIILGNLANLSQTVGGFGTQ